MSPNDKLLIATAVYFLATAFFSWCAYRRGRKDERTDSYWKGKYCLDCEKPLDNELCANCRIEYWKQHQD